MDADSRPRYRQGVITRLEIENFKAIRKVAFDLRPLTVLVGPNDSGKSSLLQALAMLGRCADGARIDVPGEVFERDPSEYFPEHDKGARMRVAVEASTPDGAKVAYEVNFGWENGAFGLLREKLVLDDAVAWDRYAQGRTRLATEASSGGGLRQVVGELQSFFVAFDPVKLAEPCAADAPLTSQGQGLAGVIDRLLTSMDRKPLQKFEQQLRRMSRHVSAVAMNPLPDGLKELWFSRGDTGGGHAAREASSGLLLNAGYLALLHGTPYQRFLIEEPENGVHPHAILMIVDVLREIARSGKQVVLTTHSPVLLSYMDPEDVRIVTRSKDDGVRVTPMFDSAFFNEMSQKMDLGELWYSVGDEAIVSPAP